MPTISYEEFSIFYDSYERLSELKKFRQLTDEESNHHQEAGIFIASIPISVANEYLQRKLQQLKESVFHAEEVISRLNFDHK
jgi:hypothetical protein